MKQSQSSQRLSDKDELNDDKEDDALDGTNRKELTESQITQIYKSTLSNFASFAMIPFIKALCFCRTVCRRDRHLKAMTIALDRHEKALDVKTLVETYTNLNLLLQMSLSRAQKFLFLHHKERVINLKSKEDLMASKSLSISKYDYDSEDY